MILTLIHSSIFLACSIHAQTVQQLQAEITQLKQLQTEVTQLKQQVAKVIALQQQVATLQHSPVQQLAPFVYVDYNTENGVAGPNVTFHGANVHIVNGAGQTPSINGLGKLIIGYDEYPSTFASGDRGGSHNDSLHVGLLTWVHRSRDIESQQDPILASASTSFSTIRSED